MSMNKHIEINASHMLVAGIDDYKSKQHIWHMFFMNLSQNMHIYIRSSSVKMIAFYKTVHQSIWLFDQCTLHEFIIHSRWEPFHPDFVSYKFLWLISIYWIDKKKELHICLYIYSSFVQIDHEWKEKEYVFS